MRIPDRLHHDPDAAGQAGGLRGPDAPRPRRLALTPGARALGAALLVLGLAGAAAGHSVLLESFPADGASVSVPARLTVRFNNRIEKALSRLRLLDPRGRRLPLGAPAADGPLDRLSAALPPLAPGIYRVEWRVLSTDGHTVSGRFSFRVVP